MSIHNRRAALLALAAATLLSAPLGAQAGGSGRGLGGPAQGRFQPSSWRWSLGDGPERADPSFDDSSWAEAAPGEKISLGEPGAVFWLRTRIPQEGLESILAGIEASGDEEGKGLWVISGKSGSAAEVYANGVYIGARGRLEPYDLRRTRSAAVHLPASLLSPGEGLVLALRCAYRGSSLVLPAYTIGGATAVAFDLGPLNFWNGGLYSMLGALCVFLGFYFLLQFAYRRAETENLYFGLSLVSISLYFYEMGAEYLVAGPALRALARGALPLSMAFLLCFFTTFFRYRDRRALRAGALAAGLASMALFLALMRDESSMDFAFTLSLLPVFAVIVFGLFASLAAVRRGQREALPVLIGIAIGILFASYDIYHQATGIEPFAWLQGLAFFALNVSIFFSLSMRQSRLKDELERLARETADGSARLEASVRRLERAGEAAAEIGRELDASVSSVALAVGRSDEGVSRVDRETLRQAGLAEEADGIVSGFLESIGRVNGSLSEQAEGVARTAAAAVELSAGAESVAANIDRTAAFAGSLASLTAAGEKAAADLAAAVGRVLESSRGIAEIVDAVNEFAERTNLLAMNAAIEAAHSGSAGRGFAIIAGEVKKLAQLQAERAGRIAEIVKEIAGRAEEGRVDTERVRSSLAKIAEGAQTAAENLSEVKAGTREQTRASVEVRASMESLAAAVAAIRDEAARQTDYSERVRGAVRAMTAGAGATRESAEAIARESADIVEAVKRLKSLAAESRALTEELVAGEAASDVLPLEGGSSPGSA